MKERLYKAKRVDNGEWVEGGSIINAQDGIWIIPTGGIIQYAADSRKLVYVEAIPVIPETVGQFTGLMDGNGKRIFEGDIIKCKHEIRHFVDKEDKIPRFVYGVKHEEQQGYFVTKSTIYYRNYEIQFYKGRYRIINKNIIHYIDTDFIYNHEIEVIGNIHDNPELLEEGE